MQKYQFAYFPVQDQIQCRYYDRSIGPNTNMIHMHNTQEILFIASEGKVNMASGGTDFVVRTPAIIYNKQGAFHALTEVFDHPLVGMVCMFHTGILSFVPGENYQQVFGKDELVIQPLTLEQRDALQPLFEMMTQKPVAQQRYLLLCVLEQIRAWQGQLPEQVRANTRLTYIFEVARLLQELQSGEDLSVEALARRFHVSQSKLKSDFRRLAGVPLHTFRRHAQLQEARILLENTDLSQGQVAAMSGFHSEAYFIRSFRQECGITPGEYRRKNKQQV